MQNSESNNPQNKSTLQFLPANLRELRESAVLTRKLLSTTSKDDRALLFLKGFPKKYRVFVDRNLWVLVGALDEASKFLAESLPAAEGEE